MLQLVQRVLSAMGSDLEPEIRNEAGNEIRAQFLSSARARERLMWQPLFDLDRGLALTIDWYREFLRND